ncbi:ABC transporter permease [Indiicoccus explosivorum]|uniref:ABC transporter permease n=1 Tax=Indiicoccus explosivorum TaxID=1917864 RepID=UPI000B4500A9|nr:ABC transporter permease subunit [Indiicoccus explosivorum]
MWRQPFFLIGFTVLSLLLVSSFAYEWLWGTVPQQVMFLMEGDRVVEAPPISPNWEMPLGSDPFGYDMLGKIILGAKYTIIAALLVAAIRMLIAIPLGYILAVYLQRHRAWIGGLADSLHYIPLSVFAAYVLFPVLWMPQGGFETTLWERIAIQILIMALLTAPIVAVLIGNEASLLYRREYVMAARTLGANRLRLVHRHLFPQMREKLAVLYGQQVIETFIVLAHLGLLDLFLGGTKVSYDPLAADPPMSISYEWAGLFGNSFRYLQGAPWLPLAPVAFISIAVLSVSLMMEGYIRSKNPKVKKRKLSVKEERVIEWNREELRKKMVRLANRKESGGVPHDAN